ncbi:MAG: hypothetical protein JSR60_10090 [Proteobacteria bacterium]|nr:hypothetical protein [Pseudomonadota bacterium]
MRRLLGSLLVSSMLVAAAFAAPDYKAIAFSLYQKTPTTDSIAQSAYMEACSTPDDTGRVVCRSCYNQLKSTAGGDLRAYADHNEHVIEGAPSAPHLATTSEVAQHSTNIARGEVATIKAKGTQAYRDLLAALFHDGDQWCAAFGGERHELHSDIGRQ